MFKLIDLLEILSFHEKFPILSWKTLYTVSISIMFDHFNFSLFVAHYKLHFT